MATIFFDTCALNYLVKNGFTGNEIKEYLSKKGSIAILGRNTLYECARNYPDLEFCKRIHSFIVELIPEYTLTRTQFCKAEEFKLKEGGDFAYWCSIDEKNLIEEKNRILISDFSGIKDYEEQRELELRKIKKIWHPAYVIKEIFSNSNKLCEKFDYYTLYLLIDKDQCLTISYLDTTDQIKSFILSSNELKSHEKIKEKLIKCKKLNEQQECEVIQVVHDKWHILCVSSKDISQLKALSFTERMYKLSQHPETVVLLSNLFRQNDIIFSDEEILKFLQNQSDYPALRTWFRTIVWLGDNTRKDRNGVRKDRVLDAIQFVEASYCTTFVSKEDDLIKINGYGRCLNPDIELLNVKKFSMGVKH